jgi:hypothetical protein
MHQIVPQPYPTEGDRGVRSMVLHEARLRRNGRRKNHELTSCCTRDLVSKEAIADDGSSTEREHLVQVTPPRAVILATPQKASIQHATEVFETSRLIRSFELTRPDVLDRIIQVEHDRFPRRTQQVIQPTQKYALN